MLSRLFLLLGAIACAHSGCIGSDPSQPLASSRAFPNDRNGDGFEAKISDAVEAAIDLSVIQVGQRWGFTTRTSPAQVEMNAIPGSHICEGRVVSVDGESFELSNCKQEPPGLPPYPGQAPNHVRIRKSVIRSICRLDPEIIDETAAIASSQIEAGEYWQFETWHPPVCGDRLGWDLAGKCTWTGRVVTVSPSTIQLEDVTPALPGFNGLWTVDKSRILSATCVDTPTATVQQVSAK